MSRSIISVRRVSLVAAVLWIACAARVHAAEPAQRVALATTPHASALARQSIAAKAARLTQTRADSIAVAKAGKTETSRPNSDGTRFQYDSCGCSGS